MSNKNCAKLAKDSNLDKKENIYSSQNILTSYTYIQNGQTKEFLDAIKSKDSLIL